MTHVTYDPWVTAKFGLNGFEELEMTNNKIHRPRASKFNYYNFNIDLSINGRMVISIQQRQQFAQII
jgi:hypothetical protein